MMTLFPAILVLVDRHHADRPRGQRPRAHQLERIRVPLLDRLVTYPRTVLIGAGLLTAFSLWAVTRVGFDYNVLNLQAKGTESVAWERRILASTGHSGFNALSSASSLEELRAKQAAFEKLPSVSETDSVLRVIPDDQPEKIDLIKSFGPLVAPIRVGRSSPVDLDRLKQALADIKRRFDVVAVEAGAKLPAEIRVVRDKTIEVQRLLTRSNRDSAEAALNYLQAQLYRDFVNKFYSLQRNLNPTAVTIKDVPEELRRKFIGENGRFLIQVHPKVDIWEKAGAAEFVRDLRTVDPDITGPPIITYEATVLMERAYLTGSVYAFVLVGGLSILMIRRMRESMLGLVPMVLGVLWTVGLMQRLRHQVQPGQYLGPAAHHRHRGRVRPQRDPEPPRGPRPRRAAGRPQRGAGRRAQRHHHHGGLRQPHDRQPPGHLQPGPPADPGLRLRARGRADRPAGGAEAADEAGGAARRADREAVGGVGSEATLTLPSPLRGEGP